MKVIKRRRSIKSCKYCYEHKLKCNKQSPCNNCSRLGITNFCIYGFKKDEVYTKPLSSAETFTPKDQVLRTSAAHPKTRPYYPYLSDANAEEVLSNGHQAQKNPADVCMKRNEITNFDKFALKFMSVEEVASLIPPSQASTFLVIDVYFHKIHPIIPVLNREEVFRQIEEVYSQIRLQRTICVSSSITVFAILFSVAYSNVAEGQIPDLLLCEKYFSAFQALLNLNCFPYRPSLTAVQSLLVTSFVVDPNMVETLGVSAILLRHAQQIGVHKPKLHSGGTSSGSLKTLWHFLLYFEGSSSVVAGLPFLSSQRMFNLVDLPTEDDALAPSHAAFANGRFHINNMFRKIMSYKDEGIVPAGNSMLKTKGDVYSLNNQVERLCEVIEKTNYEHAVYFVSTLRIFLLRVHLRFKALVTEKGNAAHMQPEKKKSANSSDDAVGKILNSGSSIDSKTVELSIILLFYTLRRLISNSCTKFSWYSKGSTVMQYLFILVKDIYQSPGQAYDFSRPEFDAPIVVSQDILECSTADPVYFKLALVEELLKLLETKLVPLWGDEDLNTFRLVRCIKERVWELNSIIIDTNRHRFQTLYSCTLFQRCAANLESMNSFNFEECMRQWELDKITFDSERILNCLSDF
ncbi:LAQU0S07e02938g1_1 [Lachancea quebecensis]|uniref:LAQU0S07e02938g1_1 n=1 Tax=Lachancea quebecensis TaxID=1654605 RepID=A0A0P1KS99_9SACH|nr:LAQU0S07e02938g1_1 [Lachancea quebecensis]